MLLQELGALREHPPDLSSGRGHAACVRRAAAAAATGREGGEGLSELGNGNVGSCSLYNKTVDGKAHSGGVCASICVRSGNVIWQGHRDQYRAKARLGVVVVNPVRTREEIAPLAAVMKR